MVNVSKCILLLFFSIYSCKNLDNEFPIKSLYFTSLKQLDTNYSLNQLLSQKNYETNMIIIKYEKNKPPIQSNNSMTFFINSLYYQSIICLDNSNLNTFYTLKHKVLQHISTFHYKNSDSYAEISKGNYYCLEREEYIAKHINLNEKNSLLESNYFYNLINTGDMTKSKNPLIEKITNISFHLLQKSIKDQVARLLPWNSDCSYELNFSYDNTKELFILTNIFVYYLPKTPQVPEYLPLSLKSFETKSEFNQIIINDKAQGKIIKFIKRNGNNKIDIEPIANMSIPMNELFKIQTNKSTSVFHNTMNIILNKEIVNNYYIQHSIKSKTEKLCYLILEILTEDTYIEKNEFKHFIDEYLTVPYELHASQFIEQELSSDLSQQSYFSLYFCATEQEMAEINYTIKFPIHFRYQPSVKADSMLTHHTVVMPAPNVFINPNMPYETLLYSRLFYSLNSNSSDNRKQYFEWEIETKANVIISKYQLLINNYQELLHQIPAGQMKYFNIIAKITSLTSIIGFGVILYGLYKYIITRSSYKSKVKQA